MTAIGQTLAGLGLVIVFTFFAGYVRYISDPEEFDYMVGGFILRFTRNVRDVINWKQRKTAKHERKL